MTRTADLNEPRLVRCLTWPHRRFVITIKRMAACVRTSRIIPGFACRLLAVGLLFLTSVLSSEDSQAETGRLPEGSSPGVLKLRVLRGAKPIPIKWPESWPLPAGDVDQKLRIEAESGMTFHLVRRVDRGVVVGGKISVVRLPERDDRERFEARVEAYFPRLIDAVPLCFQKGRRTRSAFLRVHGGGFNVARGFYSPSQNRGVDLAGVDREMLMTFSSHRDEVKVVSEGPILGGRDVVLFAWDDRARVFDLATQPKAFGERGRVSAESGWWINVPSSKQLAKTVGKLPWDRFPARYVEIGPGWQRRREAGFFRGPERDWGAALPPDSATVETDVRISEAVAQPARPEVVDVSPASDSDPDSDTDGKKRRVASNVRSAVKTLHARGVEVGLWVVPHGQTSKELFETQPEIFVRDVEGRARGAEFLGSYVIDVTSPKGLEYIRKLFRQLRATGADVFRLGGLDVALSFYLKNRRLLADRSIAPVEALLRSVETMREGVGDTARLVGDWNTPNRLAGALDGVRPRPSRNYGVTPFVQEGAASASWLPGSGTLWDVELLPLAPWSFSGRASVKTSLGSHLRFAALTGRGILVDAASELPNWALPLLETTLQSGDVRVQSLDATPFEAPVPVWVVKAPIDGRAWADEQRSVVGLFNWSDLQTTTVEPSLEELGLLHARQSDLLWFDLEREEFVGWGWASRDFMLRPGESRLLSILTLGDAPRVVAVSGSALGRSSFVERLVWSHDQLLLSGVVNLTGTEHRLHAAVPPGLRAVRAEADGAEADFTVQGGHLTLTLRSSIEGAVPLRVFFRMETPSRTVPPSFRVRSLRVEFSKLDRRPALHWRSEADGYLAWSAVDRFEVVRDGEVIGETRDTRFVDMDAPWGGKHTYQLNVVSQAAPLGSLAAVSIDASVAVEEFSFPEACNAYLDEWAPVSSSQSKGQPARGGSVVGGPLVVAGKRYEHGWGVRPDSRLDFRLDRAYREFSCRIGVDDAAGFHGSVVFTVLIDDREVFRSAALSGGSLEATPVSIDVEGGDVLSLVVSSGREDGDIADGVARRADVELDLANWCEPRVSVEASEPKDSSR